MSETKWHVVDDETSILFTFGCDCKGRHRGRVLDLVCASAGYPHGHAFVSSKDDGDCRLPFPVASQEGLRMLLVACADWLSDVERAAFLTLESVLALPVAVTDGERAILSDPTRFAAFHRYGFIA